MRGNGGRLLSLGTADIRGQTLLCGASCALWMVIGSPDLYSLHTPQLTKNVCRLCPVFPKCPPVENHCRERTKESLLEEIILKSRVWQREALEGSRGEPS